MKQYYLQTLYLFTLFVMPLTGAYAQTSYLLYQTIPNAIAGPDNETSVTAPDGILRISEVSVPTLTMYEPAAGKKNGTSIIICPGGGYFILAGGHEGADVAKTFAAMGVTAFVLKYRLPNVQTMIDPSIAPLQDAQRAIQLVRERAEEWKLNKNKIGIMGFSAGGHLASTAGTHFTKAYITNTNNTSLRPDFMVLGYPVISFNTAIGHAGSKGKLLGADTTAENINLFSNEMQVTAQTPPTFLMHAKDDGAVKVTNSLLFAEALQLNKVPVTVYLYEKGGHGFGMINKTSPVRWMDLVEQWMKQQHLL